jgi:hypothetical protein
MLIADGIRHVLVNGHLELENGKNVGGTFGQVLHPSVHMPSRAMDSRSNVTVQVNGTIKADAGDFDVTVDLHRDLTSGRSIGTLRVSDHRGVFVLDHADLGMLQVAFGWASVTGAFRGNSGAESQAFVMFVEDRDPLREESKPTVILELQDGRRVSGLINGRVLMAREANR